jgi:hypothetical protein
LKNFANFFLTKQGYEATSTLLLQVSCFALPRRLPLSLPDGFLALVILLPLPRHLSARHSDNAEVDGEI